MVKYKPKNKALDKVTSTSAEAEAEAIRKAEEEARLEAERLEAERQEAERKRLAWEARPGPVPIGWGCERDAASGFDYYWREDDAAGTTTWDRPAPSGEEMSEEEVATLLAELKLEPRQPKGKEWQFCLQQLWAKPDTDSVCNHQLPGSKTAEELVKALTLVRYFCKGPSGPRRKYQDLLAQASFKPHEKLPPNLHHKSVMMRIVDLLRHDEADVQQAAANVVASACHGGHRPCQDAIAMSGNAMSLLVDMLHDEQTIHAACLAMGRACERSHRGCQDAIAMVPGGAERLLELLEHEDKNVVRAIHFAIFSASSNATKPTRTYWERCRGFCMSLMAPKRPVHTWEEVHCHRGSMIKILDTHNVDRETKQAANLASRKADYQTPAEKALALFDRVPEPEDIVWNKSQLEGRTKSKQLHIPVAANQDPAHAQLHLATKRAIQRNQEHIDHHDHRVIERSASKALTLASQGSSDGKALCDAPVAALTDAPSSEAIVCANDGADTSITPINPMPGYGELAAINSARSLESELQREVEEHDLHHLDPGLDDAGLCRIGTEVRHCAPTGFLKPQAVNTRYGICT